MTTPNREVDTLMDNYLVISADCHAGLPNAQYRDWLDPQHRDSFDQYMAARAAVEAELAERGLRNEEFAEEWEHENAEGLQGGWDAHRRDRELDGDGVAGEVIFPDADAVTGRRVGALRGGTCSHSRGRHRSPDGGGQGAQSVAGRAVQ